VLYLGTHGVWPIHGAPYDFRRWTPHGLAWECRMFSRCDVRQIAGPVLNNICLWNCYLRKWQEKNAFLRFALAPLVLLNNVLGRLWPDRPDKDATLAMFYVVEAVK
jgi:hypothetical protein